MSISGHIISSNILFLSNSHPLFKLCSTEHENQQEKKHLLEITGITKKGNSFYYYPHNPYWYYFLNQDYLSKVKLHKTIKQVNKNFYSFSNSITNPLFFNNLTYLKNTYYERENSSNIHEFDVDHSTRLLSEKKINSFILLPDKPDFISKNNVHYYYYKSIKKSTQWDVKLNILSLDIEIGVFSKDILSVDNTLYSIAFYTFSKKYVLILDQNLNQIEKKNITYENKESCELIIFATEKELIIGFIDLIQKINPHIIIGWNIIQFDFHFLIKKAIHYNIPLNLGIDNQPIDYFYNKQLTDIFIRIPGRHISDGITILKLMPLSFENYSLETIAQKILGIGKTIQKSGKEKVSEIIDLFNNNKEALAIYNLIDAKLVYDIFDKLSLIDIQKFRCYLTSLPYDKLHNQKDVFDSFYLPILHHKKMVAPTTQKEKSNFYVSKMDSKKLLDSEFYDNVVIFKIPSLISKIISIFSIDPYSHYMAENNKKSQSKNDSDIIQIHNNKDIQFNRKHSILPQIIYNLNQILNEKDDDHFSVTPLQRASEIILDQITNHIQSKECRFYSPIYNIAIENSKLLLLEILQKYLEKNQYKIIHTYKNEIWLQSRTDFPYNKENFKNQLNLTLKEIFDRFNEFIENHYSTSIKMKFKIKQIFKEVFLDKKRGGYIGLDDTNQIKQSKISLIKEDSILLNKIIEKNIFTGIFKKRDIIEIINELKNDLENKKYDEEIIFQKRIKKELSSYNTNLPYVQAALLLNNFQGGLVQYVKTTNGYQPYNIAKDPIDYQFYIDRYIEPIAKMATKNSIYRESVEYLFNRDAQLNFFN